MTTLPTEKYERLTDANSSRPREVWVVFTDETVLTFTRFLKPGFRHCYVMFRDGNEWVSIDPTANYLSVGVIRLLPEGFDLPNWVRSHDQIVVRAYPERPRDNIPFPFGPYSCVEVVKRFLGIDSPLTVTPYQLYRKLTAHVTADDTTSSHVKKECRNGHDQSPCPA